MTTFGWGIVGPGRIAHRFADAVAQMPNARLVAVQGRDATRAAALAAAWTRDGVTPASTIDIDVLLRNPEVTAIYVATPHAFHAGAVRRALELGKPVLCEKPLVPDARTGLELAALGRERGVFLMEALWTRFLPAYEQVAVWLRSGAIGPLRGIQSSFCFNLPFDPHHRCFDPALAGGALLDIGVYNLSMTQWVLATALGRCPPLLALRATARIGPTGVDHRLAATLDFADGISSQFVCGLDGAADNGLRVFGEQGYIEVPRRFWEATEVILHRTDAEPLRVHCPFRHNGFEGEIEEAMRCIGAGAKESGAVPLADSLTVLGWMDEIREQVGVRYPFE